MKKWITFVLALALALPVLAPAVPTRAAEVMLEVTFNTTDAGNLRALINAAATGNKADYTKVKITGDAKAIRDHDLKYLLDMFTTNAIGASYTGLTALDLSGLTALETLEDTVNTFYNPHPKLRSLALPASLKTIGKEAFPNCTSLVLTELPDGLTSIGNNAFVNCTGLALTGLPDGITSIGGFAFSGCTGLALTALPDGITSIGDSAFEGCTSLALTALPDGLTSIGTSAFRNCTSLALTALPGLTSIGDGTFEGCTGLALTGLPDGLTSIGNYTFQGCTNLALTALPDGLTSIGKYAFQNCTSLALTELPDGLTSIEEDAFSGCTSLALTALPDGITSIGERAFSGCTGLRVLRLGDQIAFVNSPDPFAAIGHPVLLIAPDSKVTDYGTLFAGNCAVLSRSDYQLTPAGGSLAAIEGEPLELTVAIPGASNFSWKKDDTAVPGQTNNTFSKTAEPSDAGRYTVSFDIGSKSGLLLPDFTVSVEQLLALSGRPEGAIQLGQQFQLTPNVSGGSWSYDSAFWTFTQNSPATFTALQPGSTTISYQTPAGQRFSQTFTIQAAAGGPTVDPTVNSPVDPAAGEGQPQQQGGGSATGDGGLPMALPLLLLLAAGGAVAAGKARKAAK